MTIPIANAPSAYQACPACGHRMHYVYGCNFDYDYWDCPECGNERELEHTTHPEDWP